MAGIDETEVAISIHDEVAAKLGCIVTVCVMEFLSLQPAGEIQPQRTRTLRAQFGAFESVGVVGYPFTVEQDGECRASLVHPLLDGRQRPEGNDEDAGVQFHKFVLARAQLCGMFTAGYSAKVTEKNQQYVSVFENFAERDLFAFGRG